MRERWRDFAQRDPMFYIATGRRRWSEERFFASGRKVAEDILAWAGEGLDRTAVLEIGCGLGRVLVHFAPYFQTVHGIDIAPEMIEQARRLDLPENVRLASTDGAGLEPYSDRQFDLVYSVLVFQHIPDESVVARYVEETERVLKPGGRAVFQFDTRPPSLARKLFLALPDPLLPRTNRRFIRRYPIHRRRPQEMAEQSGLTVGAERRPGSEAHFVLMAKPG